MVSPLRLLIVDDQPESLIGLAGHLEASGHRLQICTDPLEALRRIASKQPDRDAFHLIFCDINLPGLDGQGLVRELRLRGDNTPVVFITGYNSMAIRLRAQLEPLKVLGILSKPPALPDVERFLEHVSRLTRVSAQDRRSSEFGLGSGGHSIVPGSGGHPLVGGSGGIGSGSRAAAEDPFYGTSRTFRAKFKTPEPTEGILSRVVKPSQDPDIIPDDIITGRLSSVAETNGIPPRNLRTPLPGVPGPGDGLTPRTRKPDPSGFYYAPNEVTGSRPQPDDLRSLKHNELKPNEGFRDPVTGQIRHPPSTLFPLEVPPPAPLHKRQPSSFYPPESPPVAQPPFAQPVAQPPVQSPVSRISQRLSTLSHQPPRPQQPPLVQPPLVQPPLAQPPLPSTTSRFRRSVGEPPLPLHATGTPPVAPGSGLTSRIRRGISPVQPVAAPTNPSLPSCAVACAHCQHQFTVLIKPESYTVICVHCGQLNRIDPL